MDPQKIIELEQRIGNLLYRQSVFYKEIKQLENELAELKRQSNFSSVSTSNTVKTPTEKPLGPKTVDWGSHDLLRHQLKKQ